MKFNVDNCVLGKAVLWVSGFDLAVDPPYHEFRKDNFPLWASSPCYIHWVKIVWNYFKVENNDIYDSIKFWVKFSISGGVGEGRGIPYFSSSCAHFLARVTAADLPGSHFPTADFSSLRQSIIPSQRSPEIKQIFIYSPACGGIIGLMTNSVLQGS